MLNRARIFVLHRGAFLLYTAILIRQVWLCDIQKNKYEQFQTYDSLKFLQQQLLPQCSQRCVMIVRVHLLNHYRCSHQACLAVRPIDENKFKQAKQMNMSPFLTSPVHAPLSDLVTIRLFWSAGDPILSGFGTLQSSCKQQRFCPCWWGYQDCHSMQWYFCSKNLTQTSES